MEQADEAPAGRLPRLRAPCALQLRLADDALRGRVLAFYTMAGSLTPFGNLAMGATADATGVQPAVAAFAATGFVLAGALGLGSPRIRKL